MFDSLSDRLQEIIRKTSQSGALTEDNMQEALREIRRALLEADVNLRVVKAFISNIKDKAEGEEVLKGAYHLIDYRGYAGYEPGDNVVNIFAMGS